MGVNFVLKGYLNEEKLFRSSNVCKECKGKNCCQNCACFFSPDDFTVLKNSYTDEERFHYLKAFLKRGYATIDERRLCDRLMGPFEDLRAIERAEISKEKLLNGDGVLYIRMKNMGESVIAFDDMTVLHHTCVAWTAEKGCKFIFSKRPKGGRELIPKFIPMENCCQVYTEEKSAIDWLPWQELMYKLYTYFHYERN